MVNAKYDIMGTNRGKGNNPLRICLVPGAPATNLSCEFNNEFGNYLRIAFACAQVVGKQQ